MKYNIFSKAFDINGKENKLYFKFINYIFVEFLLIKDWYYWNQSNCNFLINQSNGKSFLSLNHDFFFANKCYLNLN